MIFTINIDYFPEEHYPLNFCNGYVLQFLCNTSYFLKCYLNELEKSIFVLPLKCRVSHYPTSTLYSVIYSNSEG
jgi:hypothetical protein